MDVMQGSFTSLNSDKALERGKPHVVRRQCLIHCGEKSPCITDSLWLVMSEMYFCGVLTTLHVRVYLLLLIVF